MSITGAFTWLSWLKFFHDASKLLEVAPNEIFNGIATGLLGSLGYLSLLGASSHVSEDGPVIHPDEEVLELSELCPTSPPTIGGDFQASVKTNMKEVLEETQKNKGLPFPSSGKNMKQVNRFDMVNDCLDNHFVDGAGKGLPSSQVKRGWMKKVQHEWSILEKDLPETIFVRAYEDTLVDDVEKIESVVLNSIESHVESKNLEKNDSAAQAENQKANFEFPVLCLIEEIEIGFANESVVYTFDAGPNVVLIARNKKTAALLLQRLLFHFPPQSDTNLDRYQASKDDITVHAVFAKAPSS